MPTVSPDGKDVVYAGTIKGRQGTCLFSRSLDGTGEARQLTNVTGVSDSSPAVSPDGNRIAFLRARTHRSRSTGGWAWADFDVYVIGRDGSNPLRVTTKNFVQVNGLTFAEGGDRLVVAGNVNGPSWRMVLFTVPTDGSKQPERFAPPVAPDPESVVWGGGPSASHDTRRMALISDRIKSYNYDVFVMKSDGTDARPLGVARMSRYNQNPVILPGGKSVLFLAGADEGGSPRPVFSLWRVGIDGSDPRRVAGSGLFSDPLHWQPPAD